LFGLPGIQFYSFQMGRQKRELEAYTQKDQIIDLSGRIANFHDTARLMQHMDLIISVDSAPAHLAGALGKPVWLTIPFFPDWRWLLGREDNPWYPTMRVFRQDRAGDWNTVMKRLKQELIRLRDRHADI
jgi:ADP-heptose:LPS heptosyltransferase